MSRCEYCGGSGIVADRLTEYATQQCPACKGLGVLRMTDPIGLGVLRMTDPITHANTLAEIDDLKARIAALERERDEAIERFQLETLRTSDQFDLLKRAEQQFVASWSCPCENERECCRIVKAIRSLAAQPVNDVGSKKHITVIRSRVAALESRNAALVKAGALIAAEIDRLQRLARRGMEQETT